MHMKLLEGKNWFFSLNSWCLTRSQNKRLGISGKNRGRGRGGCKQDRGHVQVVVRHHRACGGSVLLSTSIQHPACSWVDLPNPPLSAQRLCVGQTASGVGMICFLPFDILSRPSLSHCPHPSYLGFSHRCPIQMPPQKQVSEQAVSAGAFEDQIWLWIWKHLLHHMVTIFQSVSQGSSINVMWRREFWVK